MFSKNQQHNDNHIVSTAPLYFKYVSSKRGFIDSLSTLVHVKYIHSTEID